MIEAVLTAVVVTVAVVVLLEAYRRVSRRIDRLEKERQRAKYRHPSSKRRGPKEEWLDG